MLFFATILCIQVSTTAASFSFNIQKRIYSEGINHTEIYCYLYTNVENSVHIQTTKLVRIT